MRTCNPDVMVIATHEAAHAVVHLAQGLRVNRVWIRAGRGHIAHPGLAGRTDPEFVFAHLVAALAGVEGVRLLIPDADPLARSAADYDDARALAALLPAGTDHLDAARRRAAIATGS